MRTDGDAGLEATYHACRVELLRFLVARTGNASEAEEILQEMWLRLGVSAEGPIANPRPYLYRIAQNLVVDRARARQRRARREQAWSNPQPSAGSNMDPIDPSQSAEEAMIEREEIALLASAVSNLPDGARRVFTMHKLEGHSHSEVAQMLGISASGVEKHMAVAMKHLRRALLD